MNDLTVLAAVIIIFWLAAVGYYVYVSRQQKDLSRDLQELKDMLERDQKPER